jgi:hypothetical protein
MDAYLSFRTNVRNLSLANPKVMGERKISPSGRNDKNWYAHDVDLATLQHSNTPSLHISLSPHISRNTVSFSPWSLISKR